MPKHRVYSKNFGVEAKRVSLDYLTRLTELLRKRVTGNDLAVTISGAEISDGVEPDQLIDEIRAWTDRGAEIHSIDMEIYDKGVDGMYRVISARYLVDLETVSFRVYGRTEVGELFDGLADWGGGSVGEIEQLNKLLSRKSVSTEFIERGGLLRSIASASKTAIQGRAEDGHRWWSRHKDVISTLGVLVAILGLILAFIAWRWPR